MRRTLTGLVVTGLLLVVLGVVLVRWPTSSEFYLSYSSPASSPVAAPFMILSRVEAVGWVTTAAGVAVLAAGLGLGVGLRRGGRAQG